MPSRGGGSSPRNNGPKENSCILQPRLGFGVDRIQAFEGREATWRIILGYHGQQALLRLAKQLVVAESVCADLLIIQQGILPPQQLSRGNRVGPEVELLVALGVVSGSLGLDFGQGGADLKPPALSRPALS